MAVVGTVMFGEKILDISRDFYLFFYKSFNARFPEDFDDAGAHFRNAVTSIAADGIQAAAMAVGAKAIRNVKKSATSGASNRLKPGKGMKFHDAASQVDLRNKSLNSGPTALEKAGLKRVPQSDGSYDFIDAARFVDDGFLRVDSSRLTGANSSLQAIRSTILIMADARLRGQSLHIEFLVSSLLFSPQLRKKNYERTSQDSSGFDRRGRSHPYREGFTS